MTAKTLLLLCFFCFPVLTQSPLPWLFVKSENGITLHKRHHTDGLIEIRTQTFAQTSYSGFLLLLEDSSNVPNWIDNVGSSHVLQQISTNENIVYTQFIAPWPAKDRDMVTYSRYQIEDGQFVLTIKDASSYLPLQPNYIRILGVKARWVLQPLDSGATHITYTAYADPGGALPDWLSNKLSMSGAISTFEGLKEQLPNYQNKQHPNLPKEKVVMK
ncbi:START domain-containing protein [Vibrio sp. 99-70-13A1]|uniref:START domain-containing protein n=1 Tax=Vibrio sp. 99-70-13A1 TaxID=2607601 RepID=UPI00149337CF|nr:START domain-containing protein [Vibrio sp. 99-70-13A1]NOH96015.1 hypothetical protein [Vibrio sp. 99-70-13A1]